MNCIKTKQMKKLNTILALSILFTLLSCENNIPSYDNYNSALGYIDTTIVSDYNYGINIDQTSDPSLVPTMINDNYYTAKHLERVFITYSKLEINQDDSTKTDVVIHTISTVTLKDVTSDKDESRDSLGNDPCYLDNSSVWQTGDILNFLIGYMGNGFGSHMANLVVPETLDKDEVGNYILDLYHNDMGFNGTHYFEGIISFNLEELNALLPESESDITFVIRHNKDMGSEETLSKVFKHPSTGQTENISKHYESTICLK
jgi:hypothetical protein